MFSVIIPSFNNINYLKICVESLLKNSYYKNEIIVHLNIGSDGSDDYLKSKALQRFLMVMQLQKFTTTS